MKGKNSKKHDDCSTGSGLVWPRGAYRPKVFTNADHIRALTDEELAKIITEDVDLDPNPYCRDKWECDALMDAGERVPEAMCRQCALEWLRSPKAGSEPGTGKAVAAAEDKRG